MRIFISKHDTQETMDKIHICNAVIEEMAKITKAEDMREAFTIWVTEQIYVGNPIVNENGKFVYKMFDKKEAFEIIMRITEE